MKFEFRNRSDVWKNLRPDRFAWNTYLLADDILHGKIEKTALKLEKSRIGKKLNISRKKLAYSSIIGGVLAYGAAFDYKSFIKHAGVDLKLIGFAIFGQLLVVTPILYIIKGFIDSALNNEIVNSAYTNMNSKMVAKIMRFSTLVMGVVFNIVNDTYSFLVLYGFSVSCYLVSDGTGTFKKFLKDITKKNTPDFKDPTKPA